MKTRINKIYNRVSLIIKSALGLNWETVSKECRPVYSKNGKCVGFDYYITQRNKETGELRHLWKPSVL